MEYIKEFINVDAAHDQGQAGDIVLALLNNLQPLLSKARENIDALELMFGKHVKSEVRLEPEQLMELRTFLTQSNWQAQKLMGNLLKKK